MNLNQVTVPVLNVEKAIAFYADLGLELIVHSTNRYARFLCPEGGSTFSLHKVNALPNGHGVTVYFETERLDEVVENLSKKNIVFDLLPTDQPWLWREAHLKDVDGNQLIIYHAGENRINPPWRIKK
jgi:catechol 2,3-dioxygenase-like lactoylglutathione lyase family enzyme